jgi:hypothetical protein
MTSRLSELLTSFTLQLSSRTAERLCALLYIQISDTTLGINIAKFDAYIRQRIQDEPKVERIQLYREIKKKGYNGSRSTAYVHFHCYTGTASRPRSIPRLPDLFYVPSKIAFLFLRKQTQMNNKEQKLLRDLCSRSPEIKMAYGLTQDFTEMLEHKNGRNLKRWMRKVAACEIKELKSFSSGLMSDFIAVKNALTLPWSNGQVEGQINKLKTIKRQMYGRASFDLLRKQLLLNTG